MGQRKGWGMNDNTKPGGRGHRDRNFDHVRIPRDVLLRMIIGEPHPGTRESDPENERL